MTSQVNAAIIGAVQLHKKRPRKESHLTWIGRIIYHKRYRVNTYSKWFCLHQALSELTISAMTKLVTLLIGLLIAGSNGLSHHAVHRIVPAAAVKAALPVAPVLPPPVVTPETSSSITADVSPVATVNVTATTGPTPAKGNTPYPPPTTNQTCQISDNCGAQPANNDIEDVPPCDKTDNCGAQPARDPWLDPPCQEHMCPPYDTP